MATASYYERAIAGGEVLAHYEAVHPSVVKPGRATWKAGVMNVPSGGSVSVNLGRRPNAVIFYGANWTTEDAVITTSNTAIFRGMVCPNYDDPRTIVQSACSLAPAANGFRQSASRAIFQIDQSGTGALLYSASVALTDTGFTANFDVGAGGGYKVVYVALFGVRHCLGIVDTFNRNIEFGFKAEASLLHGAWTDGPVDFWPVGDPNRTQCFFGGGGYPSTNDLTWEGHGAGMTCMGFASIPFPQHLTEMWNSNPRTVITSGGHSTGPALISSLIHVQPQGEGFLDWGHHGDSQDAGMSMGWDDDVSGAGYINPMPAAVDDEAEVFVDGARFGELPFAPGLILSYSISDEPDEQGVGVRGAAGFGVATKDFQWSALVDGIDRGSYQSFSRGFTDTVSPSGAHAGEIELTETGFKAKTTLASIASANHWLWHAFGHPKRVAWSPSIYRRVRS